jgi:hypothetical protein
MSSGPRDPEARAPRPDRRDWPKAKLVVPENALREAGMGRSPCMGTSHSRWRKFTLMREAGLLLPRADKSTVEPRCIHHMLALLEGRLGRGIKARFWEDRLRWPPNTSQCRRRLCRCAKSNGAACAAPAMKGSLYCQAHHPGREGSYGLQPWLHGRRCNVTALSTGLPCKRAVMRALTFVRRTGATLARGARPSWRRRTTLSPLPTDRPSGHGIAYTLSYARLAEPLSQCKKAFSDLSDGSTVSAEPKPLYSQPSGNSASTAELCATARPCTVGLRVTQSRRGSCRHSTRHERSLASMVLAARPLILNPRVGLIRLLNKWLILCNRPLLYYRLLTRRETWQDLAIRPHTSVTPLGRLPL